MYIETSRPRKEGDQARLVSPFFNVAPKNPYSISNPPAYCFGFFYHMYGKHIGESPHASVFSIARHNSIFRAGSLVFDLHLRRIHSSLYITLKLFIAAAHLWDAAPPLKRRIKTWHSQKSGPAITERQTSQQIRRRTAALSPCKRQKLCHSSD